MSAKATITIHTDRETKAAVEGLYGSFGLSISDAVNVFFSKSLMERGLPFDMKPRYNRETEDAIREARDIISGRIPAQSFSSLEEMHAAIDASEN